MERPDRQPRRPRSRLGRQRAALSLLPSRARTGIYSAFFWRNGCSFEPEPQQAIDWVGVGKFALCAFCRDGFVTKAKKQGVPVDYVVPHALKEMPRLRGSASAITLVNRAPNPNAAKIFINWYLSRRGQIVYQDSHGDRDSMRVDIPKDKIPSAQRRIAGKKYFFVEGPEYMDVKPALKVIEDALPARSRNP